MRDWRFAKDPVREMRIRVIGSLAINENSFDPPFFDRFMHNLSQYQEINTLIIEVDLETIQNQWASFLSLLVDCKLSHLIMRSDHYPAESLDLLGNLIVKNKTIKALSFSGRQNLPFAHDVPLDLARLTHCISQSSVVNLSFQSMIIDRPSAEALINILPDLPLKGMQLAGEEIAELPFILSAIPSTIKELDLSHNVIEHDILFALAALIQRTELDELRMEWMSLKCEDLKVLAESFVGGHAPSHLELSNNRLGLITIDPSILSGFSEKERATMRAFFEVDAKQPGVILAQIIKNNPNIESILAHNCYLHGSDIEEIAQALPDSGVKRLELPHNPLGDIGAMALGQVLNATAIEKLNLHDCQIDIEGAYELFFCLQQNAHLKKLFLGRNRFSFTDLPIFNVIMSSLENNITLNTLVINEGDTFLNESQLIQLDYFSQKNFSVCISISEKLNSALSEKMLDLTRRNFDINAPARKAEFLFRAAFSEKFQDPNNTSEKNDLSRLNRHKLFDPNLINTIVETLNGKQRKLEAKDYDENPGLQEYIIN